jgi:hypothetical protein
MFSPFLVALLVGLSVFAWAYSRFMRNTGNNTQKSVTGAAFVAALCFVAILFVLYFLNRYLEA